MARKKDKGKSKVEDTTSGRGLGVNKILKKQTGREYGININDGSNANSDKEKNYAAGPSAGNGQEMSRENVNKRILRPRKSREGDSVLDENTKRQKRASIATDAEKLVVKGKNQAKRRKVDNICKFCVSDSVLGSQRAKQGDKTVHEYGSRMKSGGKKTGPTELLQNEAGPSKPKTPVKRGTTTDKVEHNIQGNKGLLRLNTTRKAVSNVDEKREKKKPGAKSDHGKTKGKKSVSTLTNAGKVMAQAKNPVTRRNIDKYQSVGGSGIVLRSKSVKQGVTSLHKKANGKRSEGKKTGPTDLEQNPVSTKTLCSSATPSKAGKRILRSRTARTKVSIVDKKFKKKSVARTDTGKKSQTTSINAGKIASKAKKPVKRIKIDVDKKHDSGGRDGVLTSQTTKKGDETVPKKGRGKKSVAKKAGPSVVQKNAVSARSPGKSRHSDKEMVASSSKTVRTPAARRITGQSDKVKHNSQGSDRVLRSSTSRKGVRIADDKSKRKK